MVMGGVNRDGAHLLDERYRLVEQLGMGGMSVVWRGFDEVLGRQVAVKVLASRLADDRTFRHRIRIEAQAAARLCHPHITNVYDYGEAVTEGGATVPYVVMELVDGESLAARLGREVRLGWRDAITACAEVAGALAAAHARGVVHRDVTPGNVMLTATGAKVVDFGISALVGESDVGPDGTLLGTPAYLAPERLDGAQVSPATDVYAVGLLLYRCLTGRLPWRAGTTTQMLRAHLYAEPAPMPPVDGVPDEVIELCQRCLAKRPADRPTSAEVARTLAASVGVAAIVPTSPAPVWGGSSTDTDLTSAGTTILPWSAATDALPLSGARRQRRSSVRRRAEALAVGAGLVAVTGALWVGTSRSSVTEVDAHQPPDSLAVQQPAPCQVRYALREDSGSDFAAGVTVTNTGGQPVEAWRLTFRFPGDQTVTRGESARWEQTGRDVVVRPADQAIRLAPGASAGLALAGSYREGNPLPVTFQLDGKTCEAEVSGVAGAKTTGGTAAGSGAAPTQSSRAGQPSKSGSGDSGWDGPNKKDAKGKGKGKDHHD